MSLHDHVDSGVARIFDALSLVTLVGTLSNMLPSVAALLTIFWTAIRIYETDTVQKMLGRPPRER